LTAQGWPKTTISRQLAPLSCLAHRLRIAWGHGRNDTIRPARDNLPCRADQIPQPFGWKAALLLGLAAVCAVVCVFVFLSRATTPLPTISTEQTARRASRIDPQEQAYWDGIARELIAEGTLTPDRPASPEAKNVTPTRNYADGKNSAAIDAEYAEIADRLFGPAPSTPMTPAERVKHDEDAVTTLLN